MKRYAVPVLAGVVVFGAVSAFAASLNVSSTTLGSGDATVSTCKSAAVSYTAAWDSTLKAYEVATIPVTTAKVDAATTNVCANKAFQVTLSLTDPVTNAVTQKELTGALDAAGVATLATDTLQVSAASVTGVSVVVTG